MTTRRTGIPAVPPIKDQPDLHSFLIAIRKVLERLEGIVDDLDASTTASDSNITDSVTTVSTDLAALIADLASTANGKGASLIGVEDSGGLTSATNVEAYLAENRTAIDTLESDKASANQTEVVSVLFPYPEDGDFRFIIPFPNGTTVTSIYTKLASGTCDVQLVNNGTNVTGGLVSVTTSQASSTCTADNIFISTDYLEFSISSTSAGAEGLSISLVCSVTLDA